MQGRFKRDGSAAAEQEPRGATDRGTPAGTPVDTANGGDAAEQPKKDGPTGPGSRIALRNWRISTRLISLLALPVVAATTLGALRIDDALINVDQLDHMKLLTEMTGKATQLADALQEERDRSAGPIVSNNAKDDQIVATRLKADRAIDAFKSTTAKVKPNDPTMTGVRTTLVDISKQLDKIKAIRGTAYQDASISQTVNNYNALITSLLSLSQDMAQATSNSDMITSTRALASFSSAKEYASIQRAVLSAALANPKGAGLSANDHLYGKTALDNEEESLRRFTAIRAGDSADLLKALNGGDTNVTAANTFAEHAFGNNAEALKGEKTSYRDWYDQDSVKLEEMAKIEQTLLSEMDQKALELRDEANQEAILNGALIVLVLGISLVGAFVVARSMVRSLRRLQDTAQKVAQERLPELVKQLSETDPQDVDTSVESVGVHSRDEIGQVAKAFDHVHQEAVRLAAEQALLRGNVNAMFTNLSRRSQGLIQRQLSLISELESREADPDQLSSLFRLDHLATRMRRNGENLLVLAGEEPGRRWTRPVPLVDVLRAAASEVEQYERIELSGVPPTEVAGRVVNDLVHLLAELLENATSFSSPQTKVKVTGHALPDGRVLVEIHDTGIGLSPEDLAAINERLASPPTVDVSVSRRMGLFVVGRLSLRHGIRIQLRPSDSGGTTALVMLPVDVAQGHKQPAPGTPGVPGGAPAAGAGQQRRQVPPPGGGPRPAIVPRGNGGPGGPGGPSGGAAAGSLFDTSPRTGAPGADGRPALPPRGNGGPAAVPPPASGGRPQLPARGAAAPGDAGRQAPGWSTEQPPAAGPAAQTGPKNGLSGLTRKGKPKKGPVDDWPLSTDGERRPGQETPRGHEDVEATGGFSVPAPNAPRPGGGPGDTSQFPPVPATDTPRGGRPDGHTGQFPAPADAGRAPAAGPGDTSQFAALDPSGRPQSGTGQFALPGAGGPGEAPGSTSGEYDRPAPDALATGGTGQFPQPAASREDLSGTTGQYALPAAEDPLTSTTGQFELPASGPSPLFEELESNWFRGETPAAGVPVQPADSARPQTERGDGASQGAWDSPNDERWRRAEAVREPAAGGTTTSGLPRRVPRANLVEGTAEQQSPSTTGPQVSRSPDDVRGRLTNLRRGIQQGRQAGNGPATGSTNVGPTYQQER
ncbi:sensor histidine kinase [Streptomyces hesseae]|uniref:histidine kinase n=1 Tax=Streptomyces hesseae TaxID=3075519 RepID=A0ABU2SX02_9ACTN|nr:nitrate- and nitrite sensing domain-containing protein [Streptomyces sp. DSM 40473]MDT0453538.1 nitrate- and nitrite sensing domain-containing protein [Streptomyces sp. DSM 40473]